MPEAVPPIFDDVTRAPSSPAPATRSSMHRARAQYHLLILAGTLAIIGLSLLFTVVQEERIAIKGMEQFPLPHSCFSRMVWGVSCPACGLTRSFVLLFHGDFAGSLRMHPLGVLVAALIVFQIPYRLAALRSPQMRMISPRVGEIILFVTLSLMLAVWFWRLLSGRPF